MHEHFVINSCIILGMISCHFYSQMFIMYVSMEFLSPIVRVYEIVDRT
jgi:hypothetical protein